MRFETVVALGLGAMSLAACQAVPPPPPTVPYTLNGNEIDAVKKGVTDSLKDPTSALFRSDFKAAKDVKGVVYVCGMVNGKNSFGGYVGDKPFIGVLATMEGGKIATFGVTGMGGTDTETYVVTNMCQQYGII